MRSVFGDRIIIFWFSERVSSYYISNIIIYIIDINFILFFALLLGTQKTFFTF